MYIPVIRYLKCHRGFSGLGPSKENMDPSLRPMKERVGPPLRFVLYETLFITTNQTNDYYDSRTR